MITKGGVKVRTRCNVTTRKYVKVLFTGELRAFDKKSGRFIEQQKNTLTSTFLKDTCEGVATGTFDPINKAELHFSDVSSSVVTVTKESGGNGSSDDWVQFTFEYTGAAGGKTVNSIDLGYGSDGSVDTIYAQKTGLTHVVAEGVTVVYTWKITLSYTSGGATAKYRYQTIRMLHSGSFTPQKPTYIGFVDTLLAQHNETAVLNAGGDGVEVYHEWTATYQHSGATITIDIVNLWSYEEVNMQTEDDIANKDLADTEEITAFINIEHTAS